MKMRLKILKKSLLCLFLLTLFSCAHQAILHSVTPEQIVKRERNIVQHLPAGEPEKIEILDDAIWRHEKPEYDLLLTSIDRSLHYLRSKQAVRNYQTSEFDREKILRSVERFRELLIGSNNPSELWSKLVKEFEIKTPHLDGEAKFTAYYQPVYYGSKYKTAEYKYPLYERPKVKGIINFTRLQLEGADGLTPHYLLKGKEIVYLKDRFDAFLIHIQGSAKIVLPDGKYLGVSYAGATDKKYVSIGAELVKDGVFSKGGVSNSAIKNLFQKDQKLMNKYLQKNERFVFFKEGGGSPIGCLGEEVTKNRSIATDRSIMPRGALVLIRGRLPLGPNGEFQNVSRFMLDQDTGTAIKGRGRVDIFMGSGEEAPVRAERTNTSGDVYYLELK